MPRASTARLWQLAVAALVLSACAKAGDGAVDSAPRGAPAADTAHTPMAGVGTMTGNPDRDFLRMMSDHHKGLGSMTRKAIENQPAGSVRDLARRMEAKQAEEVEAMRQMLEASFGDVRAPTVTPDNRAMRNALNGKTGVHFDQTFLHNVIAHHEQAVTMIDQYLPTANDAAVKSMAEQMRAAVTTEIIELKRRLAALEPK